MASPVKGEILARCLGISLSQVHVLARRGLVTRAKSPRGTFDLEQSVRAYATHMREAAHGQQAGGTPPKAHDKLLAAQVQALEQKTAIRSGALLDAKEVEDTWSGVLRTVRAGIMRIPRRAGSRLGLPPDAVQILDDEVRAVLTGLGTAGAGELGLRARKSSGRLAFSFPSMLDGKQARGFSEMFHIEFFGLGADGKSVGPERATFPGDKIEDAIIKAERIMRTFTFHFGKAQWFEIYDNNGVRVHVSGVAGG
jgi:phage terminase Nu1 subunit (DNA packaging protein)